MVTQLLTLARLEPSAQRLGLTDLDLLPLCRETLAELTPLALARGQELTLDVDELADFHLSGDAASLATLLQNLVGNALQYTPDGGQIQVGLQATAAAITLQVDDSGPGVPATQRTSCSSASIDRVTARVRASAGHRRAHCRAARRQHRAGRLAARRAAGRRAPARQPQHDHRRAAATARHRRNGHSLRFA